MQSRQINAVTRRIFLGGMSASLVACAAPRSTWSSTTADVIVVGAGLAGLHATNIVENAGYKAILLEANNRPGGRLYTLDDMPVPTDAGGVQIGSGYRRFHEIADRLGVERFVPPSSGRGSLYRINGGTLTPETWPTAEQNRLGENEKNQTPERLLFSYLRGLPKFENVSDWMTEEAQSLDIPLKDFLIRQGASKEAMRLMDANLNGYSLETLSTLHLARTMASFSRGSGPTKFIKNGSQRMTDAMANSLRCDLVFNSNVIAIADKGDGVEIRLSDGRSLGTRHVICTAPFSVLRTIQIDAQLPKTVRTAIAELPYTMASFAYLQASEVFWKTDGYPQSIWSDDPLLGRVFALGEDPPMLKVWLNGPSAKMVDQMSDQEAGQAIINKIEQARPSAKGKLKLLRMFSWQKERFARGIYHHIGVGQGAMLANTAQFNGTRIHFAGEHMAQDNPGMEGALESGERAANRVLASL